MNTKFLLIFLLFASYTYGQSYKQIHQKAIVVDTHNDILMKADDQKLVFDQDLRGKASTDLKRWKEGGLDVQVFSVYCDGAAEKPFAYANREMDILDAVAARNPDKIVKVFNYAELMKAVKQGKIAAMFGVEGGHMIEDDLNKLEALYKRGARYLTLTHNVAPSWATSAADETTKPDLPHKGLTDFGKQVVQRMNQLGMMVDVSHVGEQTFWDVIKLTSKPIIASHSSVYALTSHRRNLKDDQIKAVAKNGGVIQINFNPGFIDSTFSKKENAFFKKHAAENDSLMKSGMDDFYASDYLFHKYADEVNAIRPPLPLVIDHIDYIVKLVGADYVGLGSDFDGITLNPRDLDDVTSYPLITKALVEKGYSEKDIDKILGGNFLRVLKANEAR
ncbi:dipeptidase [Chryseolinea sp. T2]|uniref:dipeptidase n=1 Tax=Chryseolinea sp. T2 TaxID=3129255 RepID=UPI003077DE9F